MPISLSGRCGRMCPAGGLSYTPGEVASSSLLLPSPSSFPAWSSDSIQCHRRSLFSSRRMKTIFQTWWGAELWSLALEALQSPCLCPGLLTARLPGTEKSTSLVISPFCNFFLIYCQSRLQTMILMGVCLTKYEKNFTRGHPHRI